MEALAPPSFRASYRQGSARLHQALVDSTPPTACEEDEKARLEEQARLTAKLNAIAGVGCQSECEEEQDEEEDETEYFDWEAHAKRVAEWRAALYPKSNWRPPAPPAQRRAKLSHRESSKLAELMRGGVESDDDSDDFVPETEEEAEAAAMAAARVETATELVAAMVDGAMANIASFPAPRMAAPSMTTIGAAGGATASTTSATTVANEVINSKAPESEIPLRTSNALPTPNEAFSTASAPSPLAVSTHALHPMTPQNLRTGGQGASLSAEPQSASLSLASRIASRRRESFDRKRGMRAGLAAGATPVRVAMLSTMGHIAVS